jgi:hypothetical protein
MKEENRLDVERRSIRDACAHRGIHVTEAPQGVFTLRGKGVYIRTVDLRYVRIEDLNHRAPARPAPHIPMDQGTA